MSRSRKPVTRNPQDGLSKENAKLTQEIAELEDALFLHQRYIDEDRKSVPGLIRQEVGGARWQYGGEGKLHTFRSKNDLEENQGAASHRNTNRSHLRSAVVSKKTEDKPQLEALSTKSSGPRCLNEDAEVQSKCTGGESRKPSAKSSHSKTKSVHHQQASWSSGARNLDPSSKEYDAFMQGIFGEGGFPLQEQYSVESAAVGMSLFAEKNRSNIKEMKSKVLKRASAVLIMRPRSASAAQDKTSGQPKGAPVPRNPKMTRSRRRITSERALTDRKSVTAVGNRRDKKVEQEANRISSSRSTEAGKSLGDPQTNSDGTLQGDSGKSLPETNKEEDMNSKQNDDAPLSDTKDADEDMSELLSLFNKPRVTDKEHSKYVPLPEHRYSMSNRGWDKNAVPKPWDKWMNLKDVNKNILSELNLDFSSNSRRLINKGSHDDVKVGNFNSSRKDASKSREKPPIRRSWTASSHLSSFDQAKRPQSAAQLPQRHSWTAEHASRSDKHPSSGKQSKSLSLSGNLPPSKQKAVADWLDKHVSHIEREASSLSSESSSSSNRDTVHTYPSSITLADLTAQVARVDCFESDRQVAAWLSSLGLKDVDKYEQLFTLHQIEMVDLPALTVSVLQHMGISKVGPVMRIMRGVEKLKGQVSKASQKIYQRRECPPQPVLGDTYFKMAGGAGKVEDISVDKDHGDTKPEAGRPDLKHSKDTGQEEKTPSASERAGTFRSSLQELYRDLAVEKRNEPKIEEDNSDISRETSPFECTKTLHDHGYFESPTDILHVNSASDMSMQQIPTDRSKNNPTLRHVEVGKSQKCNVVSTRDRSQISHKHIQKDAGKTSKASPSFDSVYPCQTNVNENSEFPEEKLSSMQTEKVPHEGLSKRCGKVAQLKSSGSVTTVTSKLKDRPASGKVKGQGDSTQQKQSSFRVDTGVERLAHRMAARQKKRKQEEEMLDQRLQRLREQRDALAARHKMRERSRSMERDTFSNQLDHLLEGTLRKERRKSDSGLEERIGLYLDKAGELIMDPDYDSLACQQPSHGNPSLATDLTALQMQEMSPFLENDSGSKLQQLTLSEVRKLQDRLHHLEKSLLLSSGTTTTTTNTNTHAAGAAAHPGEVCHSAILSGTQGDILYQLDELLSPGAEGASGDKIDVVVRPRKSREEDMGLQHSDVRGGDHDVPSSRRSQMVTRDQKGQEPSSHQPASHDSLSRGKSRRLRVSHRTSQLCKTAVTESSRSSGKRQVLLDFNDNAATALPAASERDAVVPKVITLSFKDVLLGKRDGDNVPQVCDRADGSDTKVQTSVPHMSMSKRQLLDEIRREKDEHRKNVRHLKSELTRLQHKDPVKKSEIDHADIEFKESDLIGEGSFCQVFHGQYQGADVAVKRLKTPLTSQDKNYFAAEVSLLRDLRHPRVVLLVGVSTTDRLPIMVLEYMAGHDLYTLIHDPSRVSLDHAEFYQIARDISSGMVYLHHHRPPVLHLDLKSMNVLLTSGHRAKIADFGFSKLKHDADIKARKSARNREIKGSPAWMAPELLQGGEVTPKADVFSFGIILWEMTTQKRPYEGCSVYEILEQVKTDRRPAIPESCPPDLSALIAKCWSPNPAVRPNFKEVLKQVEDLSFPPGWRALFKAAGVPHEALDDLTSTRHIISIVHSSLESSALNTLQNPEKGENEKTVKKKGRDPSTKDSLDTYDYCLSEEETLHLEDSLDTTVQNDSLEQVSPRSRSSSYQTFTQTLPKGPSSSGGPHGVCQSHVQTKTKQRTRVSGSMQSVPINTARASDVPLLPLDSLRSPSPQGVLLSMSSLFDSVEADHAAPVQLPVPSADFSAKSDTSGRTLTPIVPRLALEEDESGTSGETVVPSAGASAQPAASLTRHTPLAPILPQPKPGATADEESADSHRKGSPLMSARQARRLGLSRRSAVSSGEPYTSSPRESKEEASHKESAAGVEPILSQDAKKIGAAPMEGSSHNAQTSQEEAVSCSQSSDSTGQKLVSVKPMPYTPKPKERMKVQVLPASSEVIDYELNSSQDQDKTGAERGPPYMQELDDGAKTSLAGQDANSLTLTPPPMASDPTLPLLPPPPPPPPPPMFTPSGPRFSNSKSAGEDLEQHTQTLAGVHQELLQVSRQRLGSSTDKAATKKKRNFLKERYRCNPHISVEASALLEQKGQLKSVTLPHPNQLPDLPSAGQVFNSMAGLLRKAMEDRRFAMGENLLATSSQEMTEASWSVQDD